MTGVDISCPFQAYLLVSMNETGTAICLRRGLPVHSLPRSRVQLQAAAIVGSVCVLILIGLLIRPNTVSAGALLRQALLQLKENPSYSLVIEEKAPSYNLTFIGAREEGHGLSGHLKEFDLELSYHDRLLVRQDGAEEWVEASELDLASLTGFLTEPLQILESCQEQFSSAYAGEAVELGEVRCRTVYLKPDNYAALITGLFPEIDRAAIREVTLGAALTETGSEIKQLRLLVVLEGTGKKIERVYYVN